MLHTVNRRGRRRCCTVRGLRLNEGCLKEGSATVKGVQQWRELRVTTEEEEGEEVESAGGYASKEGVTRKGQGLRLDEGVAHNFRER